MLVEASQLRGPRNVLRCGTSPSEGNACIGPVSAWTVSVFAITSLLWWCTFTLYGHVNLQVPGLGTITVPDVASVAMLSVLIGSRLKRFDRLDLTALAVGAWILIAGLIDAWANETMDFHSFVNYQARLAPYWFAIPLLRRLPSKQLRYVLITGVVSAVVVSIVHIYVVLTRSVPLLLSLYYVWYRPDGSFDPQLHYLVASSPTAFIRAVPDGMPLITSVYVAFLAVLASGKKIKHAYAWVAVTGILGIAALVTLMRSLAIVLLIVMPILGMIRYRSARGSIRAFALPIILVLAFGAVAVLSERDLTSQYLERFERFSEELDPLSSPRLLDTAQGIREVMESPVFGTGLTDPRDYRSEFGKDTNGLISLGLVGGVPLMILTLLATYYSLRIGLRRLTWQATAGMFIVVHVVVLMVINTFPGFVWIRSIVPTVIGMAMAASISEGSPIRLVDPGVAAALARFRR